MTPALNLPEMANIEQMLQKNTDDIRQISRDVGEMKKDMKPILELYNGGMFFKTFITGFATVVGAIIGIGAAVIWLVQFLRTPTH